MREILKLRLFVGERRNMKYGYVRVSTKEQNTDRQYIALQRAGVSVENIYEDKQSGKDFDRMKYQQLIATVKPGDIIYIKSIDRLGRNYRDILDQWKMITRDRGVDLCIIDMPILDTRKGKNLIGTVISDVVLTLLSYVSENERENIRQRQAEGIAAAKVRGVKFGRPTIKPPEDFQEVVADWKLGKLTTKEVVEHCGMSESTFFRRLRELKSEREE